MELSKITIDYLLQFSAITSIEGKQLQICTLTVNNMYFIIVPLQIICLTENKDTTRK